MRLRFERLLCVVPLLAFACAGRFDFESSASGGASSGGAASGGAGGLAATGGAFAAEDYVECLVKCASAGLQCLSSNLTCVECTSDSHCSSRELSVCSRVLGNRCVRCEASDDCGERSVCVEAAHVCASRCDDPDATSCSGVGPKASCNVSRGYCEGCSGDDDCKASPATPHCGPGRIGCVACAADEHCAQGKFCDPVKNECVSCRDSGDCMGRGQICDLRRHTCGER
jgi:Cys-rich repeat protein